MSQTIRSLVGLGLGLALIPCAAASAQADPQFVVDFDDETKITGTLADDGDGGFIVGEASYWDTNEWFPIELCDRPGSVCLDAFVVDEDLIVIVGKTLTNAALPGAPPDGPTVLLPIEDFFSLLPKGTDDNYWSIKTALIDEVIASMLTNWTSVAPPAPEHHAGGQPYMPGIEASESESLQVYIRLTEKEILVVAVHPDGGLEMFILSKTLEGFWIWQTIPFNPGGDWPGAVAAFPWRSPALPGG